MIYYVILRDENIDYRHYETNLFLIYKDKDLALKRIEDLNNIIEKQQQIIKRSNDIGKMDCTQYQKYKDESKKAIISLCKDIDWINSQILDFLLCISPVDGHLYLEEIEMRDQ